MKQNRQMEKDNNNNNDTNEYIFFLKKREEIICDSHEKNSEHIIWAVCKCLCVCRKVNIERFVLSV